MRMRLLVERAGLAAANVLCRAGHQLGEWAGRRWGDRMALPTRWWITDGIAGSLYRAGRAWGGTHRTLPQQRAILQELIGGKVYRPGRRDDDGGGPGLTLVG